jgi:Bacterial regulatory proteins, luxR family
VEHPDRFFEELLGSLELPYVGACWHLTDPETGLFTWTGYAGELPGDFVSALENEFLADDLGKYAEIALALLRGDDTVTIAASLHLSPWTVQDHLKAIFDKTGVRSRRAFVARWALELAGVA